MIHVRQLHHHNCTLAYKAVSVTIHGCSVYRRANVILEFVTTLHVDVISAAVITYGS